MTDKTDKDVLVSIILPVYNAGTALYTCLDSLVSQTLGRIEIIAILDCPTDGSDRVVKEYADRYRQIVVIENESNMHIGESRNRGLDVAKGKYIAFCDHDDYYAPKMCETMYDKMEQGGLDLCLSNYVGVVDGKIRDRYNYDGLATDSASFFESSVGCLTDSDFNFILNGVVWNKFFRRDIIADNNIRFIDTREMVPEDLTFLIEYSFYSRKTGICREDLYFHIKENGRNTALTWSYCEPDKIIRGLQHTKSFLLDKNCFNSLEERFDNSVRYRFLQTLFYCISHLSPWKLLRTLSACSKSPLVMESFSHGSRVIRASNKAMAAFRLFRAGVLVLGRIRVH
ncbi:MAG: glycosyltransferase [Treponema sp.]|nr:glycosyltransferase [Treponema sp.]